jgi:hypothetical protein
MRDQGWMPYIIYFFIASSVLGALGTVMIWFFGLPYTWSALLYMPLLIGGFFLLYKGYSWMMWALVACLGFILLSVLSIGRGLLVEELFKQNSATPTQVSAVDWSRSAGERTRHPRTNACLSGIKRCLL